MPDEYISREKMIADIENAIKKGGMGVTIGEGMKRYVLRQPAADVAEVVRCKDCAKHYIVLGRDMCARNAQGSEGHWIWLTATIPDGFCHRGEHK